MSFFNVMGPHAFCIPCSSRYFYIMFSTPYAYVLLIMNNMARIKYVCLIGTLCRVLMLGISCILYGRCIGILPHFDLYRHTLQYLCSLWYYAGLFPLWYLVVWACTSSTRQTHRVLLYQPPGGQCAYSWVVCREVQHI